MISQIYHFIKNNKIYIILFAFYISIICFSGYFTNFYNLKNNQFKSLFHLIPFFIFGFAAALSVIFNNSSCFFLSAINCWMYYFFLNEPVKRFNILFASDYIFLIAILLPLNYLYFSINSERGIFNVHGLKKTIFLGLQFIFPIFLLSKADNPIHRFRMSDYAVLKNLVLFRSFSYPLLYLIVLLACLFFIKLLISSKNKFKFKFYISSLIIIFYLFQNGLKFKYENIFPVIVSFTFLMDSMILIFLSISSGYEKAYKDELTQIFGRRALNEEFAKLSGKYCIVMIDIDHFKKFNDTYGHKAGDTVLYSVAQILENHCSGKVFRYGGEEFTIIYKNGNIKKNYKEIDYIRKAISKTKINIGKNKSGKKETKAAVTISAGISIKNENISTPQDALGKADEYLYKAKENGRNRVETDFEILEKTQKKDSGESGASKKLGGESLASKKLGGESLASKKLGGESLASKKNKC